MPSWMAMSFQDQASIEMKELTRLHDHVMVVMILIIVVIFYVMIYLLLNNKFYKYLSEGVFIETVWSVIPAFLLLILVMPSLFSLYFVEEDFQFGKFTLKAIAHQWYWTYGEPDYSGGEGVFVKIGKVENRYWFFPWWFKKLTYSKETYSFIPEYITDSVMEDNFNKYIMSEEFAPRLLGVDTQLSMPLDYHSRLLVTSSDVIHSFAVPALGLKVDAIPGRINQVFCIPTREGTFYGQCSEICGTNHSFMPIQVNVESLKKIQYKNMLFTAQVLVEELGYVDHKVIIVNS